MANAVRKRRVDIPRRRVKIDPPKTPVGETSLPAEATSVLLVGTGIFLGAALCSHFASGAEIVEGRSVFEIGPHQQNLMGVIGARASTLLAGLLGWCSFVLVWWTFFLARTIWIFGFPEASSSIFSGFKTFLGSLCMLASAAAIACTLFGYAGGGYIGAEAAYELIRYVNEPGTLLISGAVFLLSLGLATGIGASELLYTLRLSGRFITSLFSDSIYVVGRFFRAVSSGEIFIGRFFLQTLGAVGKAFFRLLRGIVVLPFIILTAPIRRLRRNAEVQSETSDEDEEYVLESDESEPIFDRIGPTEVSPPAKGKKAKIKISRGNSAARRERLDDTTRKNLKKLLQAGRLKRSKGENRAKTEHRNSSEESSGCSIPPLNLLVSGETQHSIGPKDDDLIRNCGTVERALAQFNVQGRVVEARPGPVITLYEFEPAAGVKVQRVVNLADDLALALKVASVRVYAPVPGKGTVGIEVPNAEREVVRLRDVLDSREMAEADSPLAIALGKDTFGSPYVVDLSGMPHLLIAGATGTGKSVCINSLILSLLYRSTPRDLRFIMIDPKMLELSIYEGIPHLKAPVVTNPKHARGVLWWAVEEMERRYRMMKEMGVRHVGSYNSLIDSRKPVRRRVGQDGKDDVIELDEKDVVSMAAADAWVGNRKILDSLPDLDARKLNSGSTPVTGELEYLPRIVIVVDELADLMLTVGREIEELLTRLAQKARAAGLHLILATQRPSVNVITGLIKANFPARISFKVASRIDARTVLDTSGAEKLLGQGDMLFLNPQRGGVRRLHSAFVSDKEVQDVVEWARKQGQPGYDAAIEAMVQRFEEQDKTGMSPDMAEGEHDPLYDQAVSVIIEKGQASTSMVQRIFRIGYNRAARILEAMEREGVVGAADGARPRQVLVPGRERHL